jgi:hypothetical protein
MAAIPYATIAGVFVGVTPILGMAGVFMALGSGYAEARSDSQRSNCKRVFPRASLQDCST